MTVRRQKNAPSLFARVAFILSCLPLAHAADFTLITQGRIYCPGPDAQAVAILANLTASPQTVPAGTRMTMTFSAPVTGTFPPQSSIVLTISGNTVTADFSSAVTIQPNYSLGFNPVHLNVVGVPSKTPVIVTVTSNPPTGINFGNRPNTAVLGLIDTTACGAAPVSAFTIEDLLKTCPTAGEVALFRSSIDIRRDADPTAGTLVCRATDGSADLTRLEERTFQIFRLMQFFPFDAPLPWTQKPLWDWFRTAVRGVRYRSDTQYSFCCDPPGYINIQTNNLAILDFPTAEEWVLAMAGLFIHEGRHADGPPHTCGTWDQTLAEMGAWATAIYYDEWAAFHSGDFLKSRRPTPFDYRSWMWDSGQSSLNTTICEHTQGLAVSPSSVIFAEQPIGVASAPRSAAITRTEGGPLSVASVRIAGPDAADFAITSSPCTGAVLPPSCAVVLRFTPSAFGPRSAQLLVTFSDGSTRSSILTGVGSTTNLCGTPSLSSPGTTVPHTTIFGTVRVSIGAMCSWSATSDAAWLSISSGSTGFGPGTIAFVAQANPGAARTAKITVGNQVFRVDQVSRVVTITSARSASDYGGAPMFASGSWIEIIGSGLAFSRREWRSEDFTGNNAPTTLDGVSVTINGKPAFLYFIKPDDAAGPSQINVQAPTDAATGPVEIIVRNAAGVSNTFLGDKAALAPGVLAPPAFRVSGTQHLVATYGPTYSFVGPPNLVPGAPFRPAKPRDVIWIYGIGFGDVTPVVPPGVIATQQTRLNAQVAFRIGATNVVPSYAGFYPGFVGLDLFVLEIPDLPDGTYPVTVYVNGTLLPQTTNLAIQR